MLWGCSTKKSNPKSTNKDFERATYFHYYKKYDSAFLMYTQYVTKADDSLKKGQAYRYMGDIQWAVGDLNGAEESAIKVIKILNENDTAQRKELVFAYNLLGNVRQNMKQYDNAIAMFNKGIYYSIDSFKLELMNGKAVAIQEKGAYEKAVAIYDSILLQKPSDQSLVARAVDNRARTKWLQNPAYPALPEFWHALQIRTDVQDVRGLNASYAFLSDYYVKINPDSALWYANKMFQQAQIIQTPEDRLEAMDKIIRLNDSRTNKYWYPEFKRLSDSLQLSKDTTRNRFALIKYDSQKSLADNLQLKERVAKQNLSLFGVIALTVLLLSTLYMWYQKRKRRTAQESENAIRDANLKTSQKVHDVVANGLYGIMNELEHGKSIEREPLLTRIEDLYEKSRDISYEHALSPLAAAFNTQVHDLLTSFASEQTKVIVVGNQETFWDPISAKQKEQLSLILHELMVNMKKHSGAKNVILLFSLKQHKALITYKDDGKGFEPDQQNGNGLNNTVNRIFLMKGDITFGKSEKGGASISISLPLEPTKI
jgi:cbb3-type cytochrome oxidase subunit 3